MYIKTVPTKSAGHNTFFSNPKAIDNSFWSGLNIGMIRIKLKGKSPTINNGKRLAVNKKFGKAFSYTLPHVKQFKQMAYLAALSQATKVPSDVSKYSITINYIFGMPNVLKKDKTLHLMRGDIEGRLKFMQDAIFQGLGVNDALIVEGHIYQKHWKEDILVVEIFFKPLTEMDFYYNFDE